MENLSVMMNHHNADEGECPRPLANFQPDLWEDRVMDFTPLDEVAERQTKQEIDELKELVRKKLIAEDKDPKERLVYIDTIERLGVAYHFEDEIESILLKFHNMHFNEDCFKNDLHYVSLRFRILRQHGFFVSCEVFENLKNDEESFKENDVEAMLSLYEASHLRVHGERVLDEAVGYTRARLALFASDPNCSMAHQVTRALELPLFKRTPRLESKYQISVYESSLSPDDNLLKLAKLDFNFLQSLHNKELQEILRWSKSLEFNRKLPYTRDRLMESKVWILGVYAEPKYSYARIIANKLVKIITIVDDTYDAYGVIQELQLFTDAIQRWDKSCASKLPDYMKFIYNVILDTCEEIRTDLANEGRSYAADYFCLQMKAMCRSYIQEAKWCHENHVPTYDEYMRNAMIGSCGYKYMPTIASVGMTDISKDGFEWINQPSKAILASCVLARILNDIGSHKFEQDRGHVASAVECYMKQFGVTQKEAYEKLFLIVENAWMDLKEEIFRPTAVPMELLTRVLNLCRTLYDLYGTGEDGFTMNQVMQDQVEAVLKSPIT
ncbi:putative sesquiterpene synthase [Silene latifolia]|uniref:putative sesquiterpene synthase n=1 Tax=Silene latifolia TaxID=37657 RepID=UPI003D780EDD